MSVFDANSVDPDQTPHYAASDLGLRCLLMSLLWDARHTCNWVIHMCNRNIYFITKTYLYNFVPYSKTGVYRGIDNFFPYFCSKIEVGNR